MGMTVKERFRRMYEHREADRVPIIDSPWRGTIKRWIREGMPEKADWAEYFGVDRVRGVGVPISPGFERRVIEETDRYIIFTSDWGVTMKQFKEDDSTPEFIDYRVHDPDSWQEAKARMKVDPAKLDLPGILANLQAWNASGEWTQAGFWFGFDVAHSWMAGTENILVAMIEEPEWVMDVFDTYLSSCIGYFDIIYNAGGRFDEISWPDDMGYKGTTFFSLDTYRRLLKPFQKRAVDWAHERGMYAHLHSCGDIMSFVPELVEIGIDGLNPLEVKAGMKPLELKERFGDRLTLHGGINAVLWDDRESIVAEIERLVPRLKENGGYIFSSDHSIPNSVSLENFRAIIDAVKKVGAY